MAFWDNIRFPYFNMQELNLDWIMRELKRIAGFMPQDGNVGDILTRKSEGAAWEPPEAVNINIDGLPQDTQIMDNDQLIFYDISAQANRKIKPPDLMDSMCSNGTPLMNGTGAAGTSKKPARYDHVHPTDTSRAPANYFQNGALKVANGGTGADNADDAVDNIGALPRVLRDGIILNFENAGMFPVVWRGGAFYITVPFEEVIPNGKTFSATLACAWICGNGTDNQNVTITNLVSKLSDHMLLIRINPSGVTLTANQVYMINITGTVSMV